MREIKFRAWHNDLKQMFSVEEMTEDQMALLPNGRFCNIHGSHKSLSTYPNMIPMQFTGLKDKNGKEIYEGDIVKLIEANRLYTVEFTDSGFKLIHADPKLSRMHWGYLHKIKECEFTCEVAGNIYENPELLNQ